MISIVLDKETSYAKVTITGEKLWKDFQQLVQRGANLWPDAPPAIKEFADLVTHGAILQDYHSQDTSPRKREGDSQNNLN